MVNFPPDDTTDTEGWSRALLTDLAGWPEAATEILEAVWDVQAGRVSEWSMQYNVYGVEVRLSGAMITFNDTPDDGCSVPLEVLTAVVAMHLRL